MLPSEDWRGRDIGVQMLGAADEIRRVFGDHVVVPRDHLSNLQQASHELMALSTRIYAVAKRQQVVFDFRRDAPLFANFFKTLALLQRRLVDLDLYALRLLCREPSQTNEINLLTLAIEEGRRDEAQRRLDGMDRWCPVDQLPASTTHLLATVRDEWYEHDHKPLEIGTFLMITSVERLLVFMNYLQECHDAISQLRNRPPRPRERR